MVCALVVLFIRFVKVVACCAWLQHELQRNPSTFVGASVHVDHLPLRTLLLSSCQMFRGYRLIVRTLIETPLSFFVLFRAFSNHGGY